MLNAYIFHNEAIPCCICRHAPCNTFTTFGNSDPPPPAEAYYRDDGEVNRAKITFNDPRAGENLVVTATLDEPANERMQFVAKVVPCEGNLCGSDAQATVDTSDNRDFSRYVGYLTQTDKDAGTNPQYWFYSSRYITINAGQTSGTASWETHPDSDTASESFLVSVTSLSGPEYYLGWPHPDTPNVGNCGTSSLSYCYKAQIHPPGTTTVSIHSFSSTINEGQIAQIQLRINPAPTGTFSHMHHVTQEGNYVRLTNQLGTVTDIAIGATHTVNIFTAHDSIPNPHGSITFTLLPGTGYVLTGQTSVTIPVEDIDGWQPPQNSPPGDFLIGQVPEVEGEGEPEDPPQPKQLRQEQPQQQDGFTADQTLISNIKEYAAETWRGQEHVDRWHRVLKTLGAGDYPGLTTMTAAEAYTYVQQGWNRWVPVVAELKAFEAWQEQQQPPQQDPPQPETPSFTADPALIANIKEYATETWRNDPEHVDRWNRVLKTLGVEEFPSLTTMTSEEAYTYVQQGWNRWIPVVTELKALEASQ